MSVLEVPTDSIEMRVCGIAKKKGQMNVVFFLSKEQTCCPCTFVEKQLISKEKQNKEDKKSTSES